MSNRYGDTWRCVMWGESDEKGFLILVSQVRSLPGARRINFYSTKMLLCWSLYWSALWDPPKSDIHSDLCSCRVYSEIGFHDDKRQRPHEATVIVSVIVSTFFQSVCALHGGSLHSHGKPAPISCVKRWCLSDTICPIRCGVFLTIWCLEKVFVLWAAPHDHKSLHASDQTTVIFSSTILDAGIKERSGL